MKKSGFTLTELLAVIVIIGLLSLLIVPNVIKTYNDGAVKAIQIEEGVILDAARIYVEDYCLSPIDSSYNCPKNYTNNKYVCLEQIYSSNLINKTINFKGISCGGIVSFDDNNPKGKTYLACYDTNDENADSYYTDEKVFDGKSYTCN